MLTVPKESARRSRSPSTVPKIPPRSAGKDRSEDSASVNTSANLKTRRSNTMPNFGAVVMLRGRFSSFRQNFAARRGHSQQMKVYENTYRIEPAEGQSFRSDLAQKYLQRSLKFFLDDMPYNAKAAARLCKSISEDVRRKVKENLSFKRYKLICYVMVAENKGQTLQAANRSCWNSGVDSWCSAEYRSEAMLASAVFFAVYSE